MRRQIVLAAVVFTAALLAAKFLLPYTAPFVIALFAVIVLEPVVNRLERLGIKRSLASFVLVFSFSLVLLADIAAADSIVAGNQSSPGGLKVA